MALTGEDALRFYEQVSRRAERIRAERLAAAKADAARRGKEPFDLASRFCDHIIAMADGAIVAEGPPSEVVTAELVEKGFGLACVVIPDPVAGTPIVVPA